MTSLSEMKSLSERMARWIREDRRMALRQALAGSPEARLAFATERASAKLQSRIYVLGTVVAPDSLLEKLSARAARWANRLERLAKEYRDEL